MHGAGNDFVVIDACRQTIPVEQVNWRLLADRHLGIGADQILIVEPPQDLRHDFRYRIFNADGDEVEQCGNGARCFMRFVHEQGLSEKRKLAVETVTGLISPELLDEGTVRVNMGVPRFDMRAQGFVDWDLACSQGQALTTGRVEHLRMESPARHILAWIDIDVLSMGNPHAVIFLDQPASDDMVQRLGPFVCTHPVFPRQTNVGFAYLHRPDLLDLRVFERGSGETLSCGTGACAAAVLAIENKSAATSLQVRTRGGNLWVEWAGGQTAVEMRGPSHTVFEGQIALPMR